MALSLHDVRCDPIADRALNELMHHYTVAQEKSRLVLTKKTGDMQLFLNDLDDLHQWVVRMSVTSGMPRSSAIWQSGSILITPPDRASRRLFETRSSRKSGTRLTASIKESRPAARQRDQLRRPDRAIRRSAALQRRARCANGRFRPVPGQALNVRFTPESGQRADMSACPLCAKSGHCAVQQISTGLSSFLQSLVSCRHPAGAP